MNHFAAQVAKDTHGTVKLKTYNDSQLGSQPEALGELKSGSVQVVGGTEIFTSVIPAYETLSLPYLFPSTAAAKKVANSSVVKKELFNKFSSHGMTILPGVWVGGFGDVLSTVSLKTTSAFKGLKWRTPASDVGTFEGHTLGADPVSLTITEVFSALETHALQAVSDPPATYLSEKWYQAAHYVNELKDIVYLLPVAVSNQFWDQLSKTQKKEVDKAAKETATYADKLTAKANASALTTLKSDGLTVSTPNTKAISSLIKPGLAAEAQKLGGKKLYKAIEKELSHLKK